MSPADRELLQELLHAYGPGGQEHDVRDVCRRALEPLVDELTEDPAGNLVGLVRGSGGPGAPVVRVMAHMDELSMIVKRVGPDGTLRLSQLGTMYPANFGLGPLAVLGDEETVTAVLMLGSEHTTRETPQVWQTKPDGGDRAMQWSDVVAFSGRSAEQLEAAGVHAGTRVCVHRARRTLVDVGDFVASYFLDDRAALTSLVGAARLLREGEGPAGDAYLVCTTGEEMGGIGATWAARALPGDITLALDVGPAEPEYQVEVDSGPVIAYADDAVVYDKAIADHLLALARELDLAPQAAVWESFDSDGSQAKSHGQSARAALISLPTLSTHGYEVQHSGTVGRVARLVAEYLRRPTGTPGR
ncbi:peptidase M42 [Blastococcus sp. TBT05-19]|uniref:M42 family metallopeptidase n=1 Tax=Blastococcus sp. TBT05-19 TaxID=2250581 RepID=UPI000DE858C2|nr:peptidase M42 [Blastococcus sp. TBT05-19]RBY92080.1 peptidase M42 [Blastococcus sp. TBT05-19]